MVLCPMAFIAQYRTKTNTIAHVTTPFIKSQSAALDLSGRSPTGRRAAGPPKSSATAKVAVPYGISYSAGAGAGLQSSQVLDSGE